MGDLVKMDEMEEGLGGNFSYSSDNSHIVNAVRKNTPYYSQDITEGIGFVLSHLQGPLFPRTISTKYTRNTQVPVYNHDQLCKEFDKSNFIDCRINAFPFTGNPVPNFVFIDLDQNDNSKIPLEKKLDVTLTNIKKRLGGHPTVLWTGNGYHIYQPFGVPTSLSDIREFNDFEEADNKFLRFEKDSLSNGYADKANHPSLRSCLLRVPGSLNSKCVSKGLIEEESKVKIVQGWDGKRVPLSYQIGTFLTFLLSEKEKKERRRASFNQRSNLRELKEFPWIEKLLQTPIEDHRKFCLWRILIPYLVNIKGISKSDVILILEKWIQECDKIRHIDFDYRKTIKADLSGVKNFMPISIDNLQKEYPETFEMIRD